MNESFYDLVIRARFKNREPDPGTCIVTSINWDEKYVTMGNGVFRYTASFDDIEIDAVSLH